MERPRIIIWIVSNDGRFIGNAVNILTRQFSGVDIIGVTAGQKISVNNLPFIPLNEVSMNGGGVRHFTCCWRKKYRYGGSHKICQIN